MMSTPVSVAARATAASNQPGNIPVSSLLRPGVTVHQIQTTTGEVMLFLFGLDAATMTCSLRKVTRRERYIYIYTELHRIRDWSDMFRLGIVEGFVT